MTVLHDLYPSRVDEQPHIIDRQDPVIYTQGPPSEGLSLDQAKSYEEKGFLSIRSLFAPDEVRVFTRELNRLSRSEDIKECRESITEPNSGEVRSIFRVHELSPLFQRLCRDERLLNIVQYILGDDVYIHQSRINRKPGFVGKEFYWHSDFETWHVEDGLPHMRTISCSIALTENNEFNGPLMLIPGSHKKFISCVGETPEDHYKSSLKKQEHGVPDNESLSDLVDEGGIEAPKGPAGSVTFFDCNTMHGSAGNISPFPRSNIFFVFNAVSNRPVDPFCGLAPRPEYIGARKDIELLKPISARERPYRIGE